MSKCLHIREEWMTINRRAKKNNPVAAKGQIELQQVLFTGGIHFHPNGSVYIKDTPGPKYVGTPSPEIDKAWNDLLYG